MKKIIAGLAMATMISGIVGIPTVALAEGQEPDGPHCAALGVLPPQIPINPGCGNGN
jgi:hypothetical protein